MRSLQGKAQVWMRAYPRRWRAARGAELLGVVVDLAGPGARRLGARAVVDLVRGGWATRWREHPPLHAWVQYRIFRRRIPSAYRPWALDDIDGLWFPVRELVPLGLANLVPAWTSMDRWGWVYGLLAAAYVPMLVLPGVRRDRARVKHLAPDPGEVVREGSLVAYPRPVRRVTAHATLRATVLLVAVGAMVSVVTAAAAPRAVVDLRANVVSHRDGVEMTPEVGIGPDGQVRPAVWAVLVGALVLGAILALVLGRGARRRLDRLGGQLPPQPNRLVCSLSMFARAELAVWGAGVVVLGWFELSGRYVLLLSVGVGVVALALLPLAVRMLALVDRSQPPGLTARDLWQITVHGRTPAVDAPGLAVRPLTGPVAEGGVVVPYTPGEPPYLARS